MTKEKREIFYPSPVVDHTVGTGSVLRLIIFAGVLSVAGFIFVLFRDRLGEPFLLGVLGILAMIGVGYLFATAIGFVRLAPVSTGGELAKAFVDSMGQGLVVGDHKDRIVYANRAYADITGATSHNDIRTLKSLLGDDPQAGEVIAHLSAKLIDGKDGEGEFRMPNSIAPSDNQGPRWYRVYARIFDMQGYRKPLHGWQIADITQERGEQERFFQDLQNAINHLDHAPAGFLATDKAGYLTYINATLAEWLGIDLTQFVPQQIELSSIVAGDGMALLHAVQAQPGTSRDAVIDLDLATTKGAAVPVRFMHRVTANRDGEAGPSRTIVVNRSQGEYSNDDARIAETRFTRFFNSTPMAIAGVDGDGKILRTNAPFVSLFAKVFEGQDYAQAKYLDAVIAPEQRHAFTQALDAAIQGKADISPIDSTVPDDEERHMRFYVNAVVDSGKDDDVGAEEEAIVYAVETTEQKVLEAQMAQSQKMQAVGQLAGGIAHDFNNVLTAIILAADHLLTGHRASDPAFPDMMNIKQNANRAASLVRQLLAFSRRQTLRPEVLLLTDVLADLRMLLTRLAGNQVDLKIEHGRDLWSVKADLGQFEQVIVNLVVNARDAMPEGGTVTVRSRNINEEEASKLSYKELVAADYVVVDVSDTGTGIDQQNLKKIFEPFFTTKEVGKGTGLGLSMVYGIVKQTGGFIFADSQLGKGTTFRIFLPRHHIAELDQEAQDAADSASHAQKAIEATRDLSGSATVLLVEDEDAVRLGGVRALTSRGYDVHEASSGVEALEIFEELEGKVDLVVSDVVMPEMDGPTLLRELRKQQPDIKFIFVSGYAEEAFAKNLPEDAQFGFLPKPFSLKQLATVVKDMTEQED